MLHIFTQAKTRTWSRLIGHDVILCEYNRGLLNSHGYLNDTIYKEFVLKPRESTKTNVLLVKWCDTTLRFSFYADFFDPLLKESSPSIEVKHLQVQLNNFGGTSLIPRWGKKRGKERAGERRGGGRGWGGDEVRVRIHFSLLVFVEHEGVPFPCSGWPPIDINREEKPQLARDWSILKRNKKGYFRQKSGLTIKSDWKTLKMVIIDVFCSICWF